MATEPFFVQLIHEICGLTNQNLVYFTTSSIIYQERLVLLLRRTIFYAKEKMVN
jgi:hypothetical protein